MAEYLFFMLAEDLHDSLGAEKTKKIVIKPIRDMHASGNFVVYVNNELLHSKRAHPESGMLHRGSPNYQNVLRRCEELCRDLSTNRIDVEIRGRDEDDVFD